MFSLKNLNLACIKFRRPVLSHLLMYLISQSFQKIAKFVNVSVCVCVCVCVCINVTNQNSVLIATRPTQYTYLSLKCDKTSKVH